ncbi:S-adenosyl-L-methionine-dependent methyltransferase [Spinellus fusiger]|nr:S-adenosyl-L-methionine-dependent methyltransferase [Spinellus fusiger]
MHSKQRLSHVGCLLSQSTNTLRCQLEPTVTSSSRHYLTKHPGQYKLPIRTPQPQRPGFFTPFYSRHEEKEHSTFKRLTAQDATSQPTVPTHTKMLVRDFIDNAMYHPSYGYVSKQGDVFSPDIEFDFPAMQSHKEFTKGLISMHKEAQATRDDTDTNQTWYTPTELFKPWYGHAIAKYMVSEYKLNLYPHRDLIIYEMGAGGSTTLMMNILDYIQHYEPSVYKRTRYNRMEMSHELAKRQLGYERLNHAKQQHACIHTIQKSIFDWDIHVPDQCFILGIQTCSKLAHDVVRYDLETLQPYHALVSINGRGDYTERYEAADNDPVVSQYLSLRRQTRYRSPAIARHFWQKLLSQCSMAPNMSVPEFLPTKMFLLLDNLKQYFPHHRLLMADFFALPEAIEGIDSPVVKTRYNGMIVPCSTYMVQPGRFDYCFPTNFELLREMYLLVCRGSKAGSDRCVKVLSHKDFCERYGEAEQTTAQNGENIMLMYYKNMKILLT